jgi:hypothetical protein
MTLALSFYNNACRTMSPLHVFLNSLKGTHRVDMYTIIIHFSNRTWSEFDMEAHKRRPTDGQDACDSTHVKKMGIFLSIVNHKQNAGVLSRYKRSLHRVFCCHTNL